jgi:hypothetical protein
MTAPRIYIVVEFEADPRVVLEATDVGDEHRFMDWLRHRRDLWKLVCDAAEHRDYVIECPMRPLPAQPRRIHRQRTEP